MIELLQRLRARTFPRGIHPPDHKALTRDKAIRRLPFAPELLIPLSQHIGTPSVPVVHKGQEVVRGEPIARAQGFLSVPLHAPATGVVAGIERIPGTRGEAIRLRVYPGDDQQVRYGAPRDPQGLDRPALIRAIQDTGMVGLGGAAFPTHAKLSVPEEHPVDTLLVNGCECEPYLTTDHRVMLEDPEDLMAGIGLALRACGAREALIGIEDDKPEAAEQLRAHLPAHGRIRVQTVAAKYPQGSEKLLIKVLLGREVPSGGLPCHVGVVVQNIATLAQLGRLLPRRQGLIERVMTLSGPGIARPGNYLVPLGTPLRYLLDYVGFTGEAQEILFGGPMMGTAVASLDVPVTKAVSGVLAIREPGPATPREIQPCIHCGRCVAACPMNLNPERLGLLAAKREYALMAEKYHLNDCFECGCCAYVCPAHIPLVQYFRAAKAMNRRMAA